MLKLLSLLLIVSTATALFFGSGGGGGCCCGCGTPQPASCGCQPACPAPAPCPVCAPPPPCPPPPTAICPQVNPIYIPSCQGSTCGGSSYASNSYATASNSYATAGGCGGGGGGGGGCGGGGGGYATSGYASAGRGGYAAPLGGGYAAPLGGGYASGGNGGGGGYAAGGNGGGYAGNSNSYDASNNAPEAPTGNIVPPLNQAFHSQVRRKEPNCDTQQIKYIVLRSKKRRGNNEDIDEEEMEEVERPTALESTAAPLDVKDLTDDLSQVDLLNGSEAEDQARARGAPTFTDAKCNSKPLRDLILENVVREDALATKRQIHDASLKKFPDHTVDIICSGTGFTYLVSTTEHCEAQKDNVICFVYKRPL